MSSLEQSNTAISIVWYPKFLATTHIKMWNDDDFGIMYDAASGDTHLLEPLAMEVLRLLSQGPRTFTELTTELNADVDDVPIEIQEDSMPQRIAGSLDRLKDLGLVACDVH